MRARRVFPVVVLLVLLPLGLVACDGGGEVSTEGGGTGTGSATGSGTGTGTGSGTGTGPGVSIEGAVNNHGSASVEASEGALEIEADDFYFNPTFVGAEPGATVTVTVRNEGDAAHTFTIDDLDIDESVDPGSEGEVQVTLPEDGPVVFYCRFHQADGMQGAFHFGT